MLGVGFMCMKVCHPDAKLFADFSKGNVHVLLEVAPRPALGLAVAAKDASWHQEDGLSDGQKNGNDTEPPVDFN